MTEIVDGLSAESVDAAAELVGAALRRADMVVVPTDTVYGLLALPDRRDALDRIVALKARPDRQPMAVLVGSVDQALGVCDADARVVRLMEWGWPGALTLVARRRPGWDVDLGGSPVSVGIRCPRSSLLRRITALVGPVVATSANVHGQQTPTTARGLLDQLGDRIDLLVDGGALTDVPSTVVDVTGDEPEVLRFGPVSAGDISDCWVGTPR